MLDRSLDAGAWIQERRKGLGLTQKAFAELLGMSETGELTVRGWELGEHLPTPAKCAQIKKLPKSPLLRSPYSDDPESADFSFIDLFAGIGGIRYPFQKQGGHCVFSSEWDRFSKKTYAANFGEVPHGDITKIYASDIPKHDLLVAGFPCQAFSQAGLKKGFNDTRGTMFFEIQRILAHHRPKAFLLENVKQLKSHDQGRTLKIILDILEGRTIAEIPKTVIMTKEARKSLSTKLNYRVGFQILKATNFGVPQNRQRIYIIGFDRDQISAANKTDICAEIFDQLSKIKCKTRVGDILENNESIDPKYTISDRLWAGHQRRLAVHKKNGNGFGYSLFTKNSPYTNTISARYYKDGSEILIDQSDIGKNPRKLTPKECIGLQGFPDEYNIDLVSDTQSYKQFGNSVSVPVVNAIAIAMKPFIKNKKIV